MATLHFAVTGEPVAARDAVASALTEDGFRLEWSDDWHATVEKGSKGKSAMLGAFAKPYLLLELRVTSAPEGSTISIEQGSKGYMSGAVGVQRTKKAFAAVREVVEGALRARGSFASVTETE